LDDSEALLAKYGDEIAANEAVSAGDLRITFTPKMQLAKVEDATSGAVVSITYNSKGDPDKVLFRIDSNKSVELLVDSISYGEAEAVPLPRPEGSSEQP